MKGPIEVGKELCAAWGLDPNEVRSIVITVRPGVLPTVEVEYVVSDKHVEAFKRYALSDLEAGIEGAA